MEDNLKDIKKPQYTDKEGRRALYRLGGYIVSFVSGIVASITIRYLMKGQPIQLTPETFVSIIFTVAVGAASLILALLAINYGRISERVITERADKSIEIQMGLFQKSIDLQTTLFDKTISTLEAIGRSTGVTEQRLGDIHSIFQNPALMKQIAGKAFEETFDQKEGDGIRDEKSTKMAESLTKSILQEVSSRIEGLEKVVRGTSRASEAAQIREQLDRERKLEETQAEARKQKESNLRFLTLMALQSIKGVTIGKAFVDYWDFVISYKGKTIALDFRSTEIPLQQRLEKFDGSLALLFTQKADALLFAFYGQIPDDVAQYLEGRKSILKGRIFAIMIDSRKSLQDDLIALLEGVTALPVVT